MNIGENFSRLRRLPLLPSRSDDGEIFSQENVTTRNFPHHQRASEEKKKSTSLCSGAHDDSRGEATGAEMESGHL